MIPGGPRPDPPEGHVCTFDHETGTSPTYGGAITVTEWCACGRPIQTYLDWVK